MLSRLSMRLQLLLGAGSVTLLLAVGLFSVLPKQLDALGRDSMAEEAFALVNLVADMSGVDLVVVKSFEDPSYLEEALAPVRSMGQVRTAAIYEPSGRVLVRQRNNVAVPVPNVFPVPSEETGLQWGETDLVVWKKVRDGKGEELGLVVLNVSLDRLKAVRAQNLRTATVLTASMGGGLLLGLLLLGSRLTGPVVRLTAVADEVAGGRLEIIQPPPDAGRPSANELNRLTGAFYTMLSRLQKSQEALQEQIEEADRLRAGAEQARRQAEARRREVEEQRQEADAQRREADSERARAEEALTHLQQTQDQLLRSEKLASLGQLVAGIAHEINTPIGAVNASAEILQARIRTSLSTLVGSVNPELAEQLSVALALVDESAGRTRLGGREGRQVRRALANALEARELADPMGLADTLLEVGYRPDEPAWEALVARPDLLAVVGVANQVSPLVRNADNVKLAAEKARKIVMALKTFSHQGGGGDRVVVSLSHSIQTVLTLYENQLKCGVHVQVSVPDDQLVLADDDVLTQVWTNLVQNALQAMKGDGRLWIRSTEAPTGRLRVVVGNNGPAIPPDVQVHMFDAFFTTKPAGEGTGLGLDIVKRIVEDHGGTISVSSDDTATQFTVELPEHVPPSV